MSEAAEPSSGESREQTALFIGMLCMFAAAFMQQLDGTIVNVSLPFMQGELQATREQVTWILTSYIVAAAVMTAPAAAISARIGRKALFQICVAGFTASSVLCGMAQNLDQMVVFRFLQGASSGGLIPVAYAVMLDGYQGHARAKMVALFSMLSMLGPIAGPTLGGYITDSFSWRWNFYLNIPIGIAMMAGVAIFFKDPGSTRKITPFDTFGFVSLSVGISALQLMLDRGPINDWFDSSEIVIELLAVIVMLYLFVVHTATTRIHHFIPPAIFRDRNFNLGTLVGVANVGTAYASTALLPTYLQALGGRSVLETGILLSPRGAGAIAGALVSVRLMTYVDMRLLLIGGWSMLAWSLWEMAHWTPAVDMTSLVIVSTLQGAAMTVMSAATNALSFRTLPSALGNEASGVSMLMRNMGSAVLITLSSTLLVDSVQVLHASIGAMVSPFNRALSFNAQSLWWNAHIPATLQQLDAVVSHEAQIAAYSNVFLFLAYVSCLIPVAALLLRDGSLSTTPRPAAELIE